MHSISDRARFDNPPCEVSRRMLIRLDGPVVAYREPNYRLLYVGRDQGLLAALRTVFRTSEYLVVSCPDRGSAILFLEGDPRYELLLFELEFRGSTGLELAQLARSLSHRAHLPIVVVTVSETTSEIEELGRKSGAAEWVSKKDLAAVTHTVARLLGLSRRPPVSTGLTSGTAPCSDSAQIERSEPVPAGRRGVG
jgi:CheY-like chemotaxis protein